jgi:hypothetical protein
MICSAGCNRTLAQGRSAQPIKRPLHHNNATTAGQGKATPLLTLQLTAS